MNEQRTKREKNDDLNQKFGMTTDFSGLEQVARPSPRQDGVHPTCSLRKLLASGASSADAAAGEVVTATVLQCP